MIALHGLPIFGGGRSPATVADSSASSPDKRWVGYSFSKAAPDYDAVAALQRLVGERLLAKLHQMHCLPKVIVDVGAGTGYCTARLAERFPDVDLQALDIAEGMLRTLRERPGLREKAFSICGDGESLPLRAQSVDLVFSNLALQWCADLPAVLAEWRRVLRPGGWILFSTFGAATLCELRAAWAKVDAYSHVNVFATQVEVAAALAGEGFSDSRVDVERNLLAYPSVDALLRELKSLGAHNVTRNRPRHLTGKGAFRHMQAAYLDSATEGCIESSFEIVYGSGRLLAEEVTGGY
jgi:malonyl-CoA O-methyltransferase